MKDLKLKENEVVHCKTEKQAKKVLKIAHKLGIEKTDVYLKKFEYHLQETCYNFSGGFLSYACNKYYKSIDKTIITAKDFLKRHKKSKADVIELSNKLELAITENNEVIKSIDAMLSNIIKRISILESIKKQKTSEVKSSDPKVGDIVKAWDDDESKFVYGVYNGREEYEGYYIVGEVWYENIEKVTKISIDDFL